VQTETYVVLYIVDETSKLLEQRQTRSCIYQASRLHTKKDHPSRNKDLSSISTSGTTKSQKFGSENKEAEEIIEEEKNVSF